MAKRSGELTGIDTNVLLRALLQDDPVQSPVATKLLSSLTPSAPGFIAHATLIEMHWVMTRTFNTPKNQCLAVLRKLTELAMIEFEDAEGIIRAVALAEEGADFPDALIHTTMEQFMIERVVTFDKNAAKRLEWEVLRA
ncbi:type II toxin-antitoxin system VapC family toxin [Leucobacter viscericola]|uniref:Type II toxin-antitoxin system VapC family toxin n=1 Tax=Leucobacter viscericola TaxID=2714935 RepID=A0A6G7XFV8_9MICO|nr:type II toxin-antitoxin system VapC family toxin [Leucobacter viscericola]QIK63484.1 type II toxin-antitoxin system VapC family toxin [Leucobacter viscericola]